MHANTRQSTQPLAFHADGQSPRPDDRPEIAVLIGSRDHLSSDCSVQGYILVPVVWLITRLVLG